MTITYFTLDAKNDAPNSMSFFASSSKTHCYCCDDTNRRTDFNAISHTYDPNGNLLNDGVSSYSYDPANRLSTVNGPSSAVSSYTYNSNGDRLQSTVNGQTTSYVLDLNTGLTQVLGDGTNTYLYGNGRIAQANTTTQYFLSDALGSVHQMSSTSGAITLAKSYDPYGVVNISTGADSTPYGFTGEQTDPTSMVYLRARYYAPGAGRFVSRDTWSGAENRPLSYNRWNYTEGNPVNLTDPTGNDPRDLAQWMVTEMRAEASDFRVQKIRDSNTAGNIELQLGVLLLASGAGCPVAAHMGVAAGLEYAIGFLDFYNLVKDHGPFDVKHKIKDYLGEGIAFGIYRNLEFSDTGNILYGFVGASIGYPDPILYAGAGIAEITDPIHKPPMRYYPNISPSFGRNPLEPCPCQWIHGKDKPYIPYTDGGFFSPTYGDGKGDYNAVTFGINLYKSFGLGITLAQFLEKLSGAASGLDQHAMSTLPVDSSIADLWPNYPAGFFDPTK